jgi:ribosomal protein S24E
MLIQYRNSDVLHPSRPNVSKEELRTRLSELYKANKDQVSCFGFRTQYGGGKSTGFALIYDSAEAMKNFEPRYRLIRYGQATKIEKPSRQQRAYIQPRDEWVAWRKTLLTLCVNRQAEEESPEGVPGYGEAQGWRQEEEISGSSVEACVATAGWLVFSTIASTYCSDLAMWREAVTSGRRFCGGM